jgi:hypothetical protein
VNVYPGTDAIGLTTVELRPVEVEALFSILNFVAIGGTLAEKPDRDMAGRLRDELEIALRE